MYRVKTINCNEKYAEYILQKILNDRKIPNPVQNRYEDVAVLFHQFDQVRNIIAPQFPEIRRNRILLCLTAYGIEYKNIGGFCKKCGNKMFAIGIGEEALMNEDKLKYYLFHEIAHLKYFEHTERFYETLDYFRYIYSLRKNEPMVDVYENRERAIKLWKCGIRFNGHTSTL